MKTQTIFVLALVAIAVATCSSPTPSKGDKLIIGAIRDRPFSLFIGRKTQVYQILLDGNGEINEKSPWKLPVEPMWSPDGQWVAYESSDSNSNTRDIFIARSDGNDSQKVVTFHENTEGSYSPSWSPDSTQITYASYNTENSQYLTSKIYTVDVSCIFKQENCNFESTYIAEGTYPSWSPLGSQIIYANRCVDEFHTCIFASDIDGSEEPVRLTPTSLSCNSPEWSPDGMMILAHCYDPNCGCKNTDGIYLMNADGSDFKLLVQDGSYSKWSPDGSYLIVVLPDHTRTMAWGIGDSFSYMSHLYRVDPTGNNLVLLNNYPEEVVSWFSWYPSSFTK